MGSSIVTWVLFPLLSLPLILALTAIAVRKKNQKQKNLICAISGCISALWIVYLFVMFAVAAAIIAIILGVVFGIIAIVKKDRKFLIGIGCSIAVIVLAYIVGVVITDGKFTGIQWNTPDSNGEETDTISGNIYPAPADGMVVNLFFESNGDGTCYIESGHHYYGSSSNQDYFDDATGTLTIPEYSPQGDKVTGAFFGAYGDIVELVKVVLPDGIDEIHRYTFQNCANLRSINLEKIKFIGDYAFSGCVSLEGDTSQSVSQYGLPSIINIGKNAFWGCKNLKSLRLGSNLAYIDDYAFAESGLTSMVIPDHVGWIGEAVFNGCKDLQTVNINSTFLTLLPKGTFTGCESLIGVTFVDGVLEIGADAFNGSAILFVELPDTVTTISESAFYWCKNLSRVMIPASVDFIGDNAFGGCDSINYVYWGHSEVAKENDILIRDGNEHLLNAPTHYYDLDGFDFSSNGDGTCSIYATGNKDRTQIVIPDKSPMGEDVTEITDGVFINNYNLTTVTIPLTIKTIGNRAFSGCSSLQRIIYEGTQESWQTITIGSQNDAIRRITPEFLGIEMGTPEN